jgi:hypothetical protein
MKHVLSQIFCIEEVVNQGLSFNIPPYQRPYVWPESAVKQLFDDIYQAYLNKDKEYFIGTVLVSATQEDDKQLELIDGQQRITTLTLLSLALTASPDDTSSTLLSFTTLADKPRLSFAIRDKVNQWLGQPTEITAAESNNYVRHIEANYRVFLSLVAEKAIKDENDFADYLARNVKWVSNQIPPSVDLNQLFATMNTAGKQLESHDILKAQLLEKITTGKSHYAKLWEACENLFSFFESTAPRVFPELRKKCSTLNDFREPPEQDQQVLEAGQDDAGKSLAAIVGSSDSPTLVTDNTQNNNHEEGEFPITCRSIISFPLLLIHSYRIFIAQRGQEDITPRLHERNLLSCFEPLITNGSEAEVKEFFDLLWRVRFCFDKYVMKWLETPEQPTEALSLNSVSASPNQDKIYFSRSDEPSSWQRKLTMLQSVLYFTGEYSAQYWLTTFLAKLVTEPTKDYSAALKILEDIDNQLSLTSSTQKEESLALAAGNTGHYVTIGGQLGEELQQSKGTRTPHYWFQKLEYILWLHAQHYPNEFGVKTDKLNRYKITSKNSVEHIFPQNPEREDKLEQSALDSFGNLALLSPSQNSAYSNKAVSVKRAEFFDQPQLQSMKLAHAFKYLSSSKKWDSTLIKKHEDEVIGLIQAYYTNRQLTR